MAHDTITHYNGAGVLTAYGGYNAAVLRLCELEDQQGPDAADRLTARHPDGTPFALAEVERVLARLYFYEHNGPAKCSQCREEIARVKPCPYNARFGPLCDDCCEECYESEPFPCREHDARRAAPDWEGPKDGG